MKYKRKIEGQTYFLAITLYYINTLYVMYIFIYIYIYIYIYILIYIYI